jgi:two-component system, OmpR family, sensor histidine kinase BaeS
LLVIALASLTFYVTSELSLPLFLSHHLNDVQELNELPNDWTMNAMTEELTAGYRAAHNEAVLWGLAVSALLASVVSFFMTRQIVAPVKKMEVASRRITEGRYQERLETNAPGEIGDLAHSFNGMAEALESVELKRAELIGNVAHEFRTPLSGLRGYIEGYRDNVFNPDEVTLGACLKQLSRLEHLIDDLSLLSKVEAGIEMVAPQPVFAYKLLGHIKDSFTPSFANKGVDLQLIKNLREDVQVFADPNRTLQILSNLVSNAPYYTPIGGRVALWLDVAEGKLVFHVQDTGQGISEEDLPHVFTRFFRSDKARSERGSGIGLTIARYFVEAQRGEVKVESKVGEGSHFYFSLPLLPHTFPQAKDPLLLKPALK